MKAEDISDAIGMIDDEMIEDAARSREAAKKRGRRPLWITAAACAACVGIIGGIAMFSMSRGGGASQAGRPSPQYASLLAAAVYPEQSPYPDERSCIRFDGSFDSEKFDAMHRPWHKQNQARYEAKAGIETPLEFYRAAIGEFLSGAGGKNRVCSPVNLYMALAVLAETAGGSSRTQILDLLGINGIEQLREQVRNMWMADYCDDGAVTAILANSLWLNENIPFDRETLSLLAENYYASSFGGDPASGELAADMRKWLNDQTGGLLKDAAESAAPDPEMLMTLCSTVYFRAKWSNTFDQSNNETKTFHGANGDVETEFMRDTDPYGCYYWGEDFGATYLSFSEGGRMWFILPDEDKTVDDVLASGAYLDTIMDNERIPENRNDCKLLVIHISLPKFDISSDIELTDGLKALGVTDVFDVCEADFSPLLDSSYDCVISGAKHAARVTVDEEGVAAAAFTEMMYSGAAIPPDDEIDFTLDRPFIFVITGKSDQPLFVGTVNDTE